MTSKFLKLPSIITAVMLSLSISLSCADKEIADDNSNPVDETPKPVEKDTESWVYRKNSLTGKNEKFFGIVHYSIPGYNHHRDPDPDGTNEAIFKKKTTYVNTIIMDNKFVRPYMTGKILIINNYLRYKIQVYLESQNLPGELTKTIMIPNFLKKMLIT